MGLIKILAIGAAVAYGINYVTKKRADGRSILDDITDEAPEWMDKAKKYGEQTLNDLTKNRNQAKEGYQQY